MKSGNIRLLLIGLVIIIVCAVVFMRGDQLVELVETMKQGATLPLIAAICTQLGKYLSQSFAYSHCFKAVNERMKPRSTLPLVFGTFFMNTIAPAAPPRFLLPSASSCLPRFSVPLDYDPHQRMKLPPGRLGRVSSRRLQRGP